LEVSRQKKVVAVRSDARGSYRLSFVYRGEYLLYTEARGSTLIAVSLSPECCVSSGSIRRWNELWPISASQRALILDRVAQLFSNQGRECRIVP
jgi:hypothetical protein